ncbi:hypothetical protein M5X05_24700 [Paenibacillus alvei]|uniref:hypothetical protein n=1 Tax=Paenibacillus alvei TaxID=44250 RepID=UPI000592B8E3|nr:hypothetical protein [Paenibacillus alvei]MCY9707360.1 hypothetical protein [Paenibacillus alvei]
MGTREETIKPFSKKDNQQPLFRYYIDLALMPLFVKEDMAHLHNWGYYEIKKKYRLSYDVSF